MTIDRSKVKNLKYRRILLCAALVVLAAAFLGGASWADKSENDYQWVAGDFHQHTTYTDGSNSFKTVMYKNNQFGLDWWANSEHGGSNATDARGPLTITGPFDVNGGYAWTDPLRYLANIIIPGTSTSKMMRWQSLRDFSFADTMWARATFRKPILQSVEWNVPGHEHCSVGNIANQFSLDPNANAIAQFEYLFDANDGDMTGGLNQGWAGKNTVNKHAKAVEAVAWLQEKYGKTSYAVFAHVERKGPGVPGFEGTGKGYNISDFRDFNNAAPDVCFGFESMPGHQKESSRGGYGTGASGGGTFGGTGVYSAQVGGLWDALLGEGRNWWLFASSDFHETSADFWPGEYQKTYTKVADPQDPQAIIDGLRSGNSFVVEGDLINGLDFTIESGDKTATMGQTLGLESKSKKNITITIKFRSPKKNNNGDPVNVDHIDLIAGNLSAPIPQGSPNYNVPTNPTTRAIATFTKKDWRQEHKGDENQESEDGWYVIRTTMQLSGDVYFRLRGTNLAPNTPNQTDMSGNPLSDTLVGANDAAKAYQDLWFYSNPIFVRTSR